MIVTDTLRADHVGCYGQPEPLTPGIDRFAEVATKYTHAFATAPWTLSSHASMFTGTFPFEHGSHFYDQPVLGEDRNMLPLENRFVTLAEVLSQLGYNTAAISANSGFVTAKMGLAQGFEHFDSQHAFAPAIVGRVKKWFSSLYSTPFFLYINFMDAHFPYNTEAIARLQSPGIDIPITDDSFARVNRDLLEGREKSSGELLRLFRDRYRLGVAHTDNGVSAILDEMSQRRLFDDTIIVVVSDHGEFLGEHAMMGHGRDVYQETIHVPLLIKAAQQESQHVDPTPISLAQLPALICANLPEELRGLGREVFGEPHPDSPIVSEAYYCGLLFLRSEVFGPRFQRIKRAITDWPYKYAHSSNDRHELFHLENDPGEQINLYNNDPERAGRLLSILETILSSRSHAPPPTPILDEIDAERRTELRNLGYL